MNIIKEQKATVFQELESKSDKIITRVISTYEGKDQEDKAIYSSWIGRFVGDSLKKAKKLDDKDKIILKNAKVENVYSKKNNTSTAVVTIFDFELED